MTARDIAEVVAELRRLEAAATSGPWIGVRLGKKTWGIGRPGNNGGVFFRLQCVHDGIDDADNRADATLLLEARNSLPAILERIAVLERAIAEALARSEGPL